MAELCAPRCPPVPPSASQGPGGLRPKRALLRVEHITDPAVKPSSLTPFSVRCQDPFVQWQFLSDGRKREE